MLATEMETSMRELESNLNDLLIRFPNEKNSQKSDSKLLHKFKEAMD